MLYVFQPDELFPLPFLQGGLDVADVSGVARDDEIFQSVEQPLGPLKFVREPEDRILELKREVNELSKQLNRPTKYSA